MKVLLVDGHSFCYRAFYAIRELRNSKGEPTNAIYGFITMLEKLVKDHVPDGLAVTFDAHGPTFRHERYEQYKIHRSPMPDDMRPQIPLIKDVLKAMNIPVYELKGYEADDVLGTIAKKLEKNGHEAFIVTGDKDMLQLVTKKVKVINPQKENFVYGEAEVKERFGVGPDKVVEIMSLMGDSSDNIPGVPGVGPATAEKLIVEYGTLENVLKNIPKIKGDKLKENLDKFRDQAHLSRELATIDSKVPIDVDVDDLRRREPDTGKLVEYYKRFEFRTLLKNVPAAEEKNADDKTLSYTLIRTQKDFDVLRKRLEKDKEWAFDFETTDVNAMIAQPIGISFALEEKEAFYVQFGDKLPAKKTLLSMKDLFEDPKHKKVGQNLKYEATILEQLGIRLDGIHFDTMVASYCVNPAKPNHNLDDIAMEHLGLRITPITDLIGSGKNEITMDQVDIEKLYRYGCQDSDIVLRLKPILAEKMKEREATKLFEEMEMPLVRVLTDMEVAGIAVDKPLLREMSKEMEKQLAVLTKKIHAEAGEEFNINSPKQLAEILFVKLKLPMVKKTKTGASTNVEVLQELAEVHSLPKEILKFRELSKLKSTYVDALPELVNPNTNRVHSSFNQTVTATGRLSSTEPNLQNIPIRTEEGRKIRRAFVAESKKSTLISADYSQIELRVLAHLSGDKQLIKAFNEGADIHRYTASLIFNCDMKDVADSMRASAKTVNFGVLYGMGPFSLAKSLGITNEAAKDFIKAYFDRYPKIQAYLNGTVEEARKNGFVSTVFNRRRYIPEIQSKDPRVKSFAERTAINAPLQGTAADVIKVAMIGISEELRKKKLGARMLLQVHDELVFEAPKDELDETAKLVVKEMQGAVEFKVPMSVSIKSGPNWLDMEPVKSAK